MTALRADLRAALPPWIAARLLVGLGYVLAIAVAEYWVPGGRPQQIGEGLLAWDGSYYRDIAVVGYEQLPTDALRFFPFYPLIGRVLGSILLNHPAIALVVVANVCSLGFAVIIRRLVIHEKSDSVLADRAVWLTALFPSSFVFVWAYAEGLFLATAASAFLAARQRKWWWAAGFASIAAMSRPLGVALVAALAVEAWRGIREASTSEKADRCVAVVLPVVVAALYLLWVGSRFGDALLPLRSQGELRGEAINPVTRLFQGLVDVVGAERFGDGLHIPFALAFVALLVVVFRNWPVSYGVFAAIVIVAALSADNLNSLERYGLNAFPILLGLAGVTAAQRTERVALAVCGAGLVSLSALAWLGVYVP